MPVDVVMPKLGLNMTEGLVVEWLKREGDRVERDDALFVVETDKITSEVLAQVSGTLGRILIPAGQVVAVRTVVALISQEEESELPKPSPQEASPLPPEKPATQAAVGGTPPAGRGEAILATPIAKRMANS